MAMETTDTYITINSPGPEVLYKDKQSKFFGYSFPVTNRAEIKAHLAQLKKQHHSARHWCYAWRLGTTDILHQSSDDGEPSNSAGPPILGQLQSFNVTNVLVIVVRYFGGVKLGVGGLITAYKTTAQLTLEAAPLCTKIITIDFLLRFEYPQMNTVMRIIKTHQLEIIHQQLMETCELQLRVRKDHFSQTKQHFTSMYKVDFQEVKN